MAEIAPFAGIRYNELIAGGLDRVVSPPYDIISPDDRIYYHQLSPYNFVRLILGEETPADTDSDNRFTRARRYLEDWLTKGVLKRDERPAVYVYQQEFERDGARTIRGFTCAVKLHDYADGIILPHENTLAKPKSQLGQLIRETRANLDSVYGLYADPERVLDQVMDKAVSTEPAADVTDRDGVRHKLWVVDDPREIDKVAGFLRDKPIAIADGHHRYETALAYRNEMREKDPDAGDLPSDFTLMTIVNVYEKDMTIFPTHRVVGNLSCEQVNALPEKLAGTFEVLPSSRASLTTDMTARGAIGMYRRGDAKTLSLRVDPRLVLEGSEASRSLELNVLHKLILDGALGIDDTKLRNQTHIIYTRDAQEAMDLVDSGERSVAFLLNEIRVKTVLDIAEAGEKMPQKATYFYPKLLSGLVLRRMD